jgi:hypothetical protein
MNTKIFEVRDRMTCCVVMATAFRAPLSRRDRNLLALAGYGRDEDLDRYVLLAKINGGADRINDDSFAWGDRTFHTVHRFLEEQFDNLTSGDLLDVRVILGETDTPATTDAPDRPEV